MGKQKRNTLAHIKIISIEEKTGNVSYAAQKTTVDITTAPDVKEFIPKTDRTKWDQVDNVNVWKMVVAIAEKGRKLIKLFPYPNINQNNE